MRSSCTSSRSSTWATWSRGAEGLVRWEHPELGLIPPATFIPAVEQSGLIVPLTNHVLDRAIAQCARMAPRRAAR